MYLLELVSEDGNIVAEKFNKQVEIVNKYQFSEKSIRNSVKSGNFIKSKNVSYKVSELDDNDVGDILNNMPLSEHMTPSYEKVEDYTIEKDNVFEGKIERKPKYEKIDEVYHVYYGKDKVVKITEEELSRFKKLYCNRHGITIEQLGLEFNMLRAEVFAIKSAFDVVKTSIPYTNLEIDSMSVEEMAEETRIHKKKAYFKRLDEIKVKDMEEELKKLHQKDYYYNKLIDKMAHIKIKDIETRHKDVYPITIIASLSDLHVGAKCDNIVNKYDINIFKERMKEFTNRLVQEVLFYEPEKVIIQNIGDSISGIKNIANRIESDAGLIDSTIVAVEEIASMLKEVSKYAFVEYYNVFANHSELHKDKILNIEEENLERFITWGLKNIFDTPRVIINDAEDVVSYELYGEIVAIHHGHNNLSIEKITSKTKRVPKSIYQGHFHSFCIKTVGMTEMIQVGAMLGTDSYALSKGFIGEPSQLITIVESDWKRQYIPIYFKGGVNGK